MRLKAEERADRIDMYAKYKQLMAVPMKHSEAIKAIVLSDMFDPSDAKERVYVRRYVMRVIRSEKRKDKTISHKQRRKGKASTDA